MEVKFNGSLIKQATENDFNFKFILSSDSIDRDFEQVKVQGIDTKNFLKNPKMYFMHRTDQMPIGLWKLVKREKRTEGYVLAGVTSFNHEDEEADRVSRFVKLGYLNMASIGFITLNSEFVDPPPEYEEVIKRYTYDGKMRIIKRAELLEASIVGIGSNPDALMEKHSKGLLQNINNLDMTWLKEKLFDPRRAYFLMNNKSIQNDQLKLFENREENDYTITSKIKDQPKNEITITPEYIEKLLIDSINKIFDDDIDEKAGAVLNKKNKGLLQSEENNIEVIQETPKILSPKEIYEMLN